jgi:hypothetical protein
MRYVLCIFSLIMMFSCMNKEPEPRPKTQEELRKEEEGEIIKAVVLHYYEWDLANKDTNKTYNRRFIVFLSRTYDRKKVDLDSNIYSALADSFKGTHRDVRPMSRCQYIKKDTSNEFSYGFYDTITGENGSSFSIVKIEWLSPLTVKVRISIWSGPESGAGFESLYTKKNLKWVFVLSRKLWIASIRQEPPYEKRLPAGLHHAMAESNSFINLTPGIL